MRRLFFTVLIFLSFLVIPLGFAQNVRPIVRLIYFVPSDRQAQPDINTKLDTLIKKVQTFYADEMERHGYGRKTFAFETDRRGNAVVHRVRGLFADPYYHAETFDKLTEEISRRFDVARNIYLIFIETGPELVDGEFCGTGRTNWSYGHVGGHAVIPASGGCFDAARGVVNAAHELGHAFLLYHDFRNDAYIMSYGKDRTELSACAAVWLDAYRYFNTDTPKFGTAGTLDMLSVEAVDPATVRFRFSVFDPDGLHQAQLLTKATALDPTPGSLKLIACQALSGTHGQVDMLTRELTRHPPENVTLQVLDVHGNFQFREFPVDINSVLPAVKVVSIPDANLAAAIREAIGDTLTTRTLFNLTVLDASNHSIKDLTGLEHATYLTHVNLQFNNAISDLSPLAGLTRLTALNLWGNAISNVSPLAGLTHLKYLYLQGNAISELSPLSGLTQLTHLYLESNNITDVSVLSGLTQLTHLRLSGNEISDVSPLVRLNLTHTEWGFGLYLDGNPLSYASIHTHIPAMQAKGVVVSFDNRTPRTLVKLSGDAQQGKVNAPLAHPLVVEVRDQWNQAFEGVPVTFAITQGGGWLTATNTPTDANGRVETRLTFGRTAGTTTVGVSAPEVSQPVAFTATTDSPRVPVSIPDANLRAKILDTLGKSRGSQLTTEDMFALTRLEARNANIENLTGLEHAHNLRELVLSAEYTRSEGWRNNNAVSDFSPLQGLTQLTELSLSVNRISDISTLSRLTHLTRLDLSDNNIIDVSPLSALTQLIYLRLSSNNISNVLPLSALTQLTHLDLQKNYVSDLSPLSGLTQLTNLYLASNNITDVSVLSGLTRLRHLKLWGNNISDVSPLVGLNLTRNAELRLKGNPLSYASIHTHIPAMQAKGIAVNFDSFASPALLKISGDTQESEAGRGLPKPFVVEAQNEHGTPMRDVSVTFAVTEGGGTLSRTTATTNANGRAQTYLTLGHSPGKHTVTATAPAIMPSVLTFTAIATGNAVNPTTVKEDVNRDGVVDLQDTAVVRANMGQRGQNAADVNGEGVVDVADLLLVLDAAEAAAGAPAFHAQMLQLFTTKEVRQWLVAAKALANTSPTSQRGIQFLEQLLTALIPSETALLANYPNPFNPETWIPYQLAKPAEVVLSIYAADGQIVRQLALGHQPAGMYQTRSRAAYWDGRNALGEQVASGVYLYTLTAGAFTATRKLLIRK